MINDIYTKLVDFLSSVLGQNYEIAYYTGKSLSAYAVSHGYVSGVRIGSPLPDEARELIDKEVYRKFDFQYLMLSPQQSGTVIQSSMYFIKTDDGALSGVLVINANIGKYQQMCEDFLSLVNMKCFSVSLKLPSSSASPPDDQPPVTGTVTDITRAVLKEYLGDSLESGEKLSPEDKVAIVRNLSDRGVFHIKGAISTVAQHLNCSEASVYRYLSNVTKNGGDRKKKPNIIVF